MNKIMMTSLNPIELKELIRESIKDVMLTNNETSTQHKKMSQTEACRFLGISQTTIIDWKRKGLIPFYQLSGTRNIYYLKAELIEASRKMKGGTR